MSPSFPSADFDPMLLDLFRIELENHTRVIENGLVGVESEQTSERIEPLMRAAHSIKGAARIVGLSAAVSLAHAMEDILSAAQQGKLTLTGDHVDLLLKGNDAYMSMSRIETAAIPGWLAEREVSLDQMARALRDTLTGTVVSPSPAGPSSSPPTGIPERGHDAASCPRSAPDKPAGDASHSEKRKRPRPEKGEGALVRVMTEHLDRLMGLAGECLVQAQSIKAFYPAMLKIRKGFPALASGLENLLQSLDGEADPDACTRLRDGLLGIEKIHSLTTGHTVDFELSSRRLENLAHRLYGEVVASREKP